MSILATLQDPTSGTARVGGYDVRKQKHEVRKLLGYLPQDFGLYPSLTTYETLDYMAILYNISSEAERKQRIESAMSKVNLTNLRDRPVGTLSGGMKQRVALAQAFLHTPKLLIVDEPTAGLDPEERIRVRSLLAELGGSGVIILSTHLIEDVEAVADKVAVLHRGRIRFHGTIAEMLDTVRNRVWQIVLTPTEMTAIRGRYLETGLLRDGGRVLLRVVAEEMKEPNAIPIEPNLEDAYIHLMREENPNA